MVELISWSDRFSIGSKVIDEQHQQLVKLINVVLASKKQGRAVEFIEKILTELANYADYHFSTEEILLAQSYYPKLAEHKALHDEFREWLRQCQARLSSEKEKKELPAEVLNYLKMWLTSHILNHDKKNAYYLCKGQAK